MVVMTLDMTNNERYRSIDKQIALHHDWPRYGEGFKALTDDDKAWVVDNLYHWGHLSDNDSFMTAVDEWIRDRWWT